MLSGHLPQSRGARERERERERERRRWGQGGKETLQRSPRSLASSAPMIPFARDKERFSRCIRCIVQRRIVGRFRRWRDEFRKTEWGGRDGRVPTLSRVLLPRILQCYGEKKQRARSAIDDVGAGGEAEKGTEKSEKPSEMRNAA